MPRPPSGKAGDVPMRCEAQVPAKACNVAALLRRATPGSLRSKPRARPCARGSNA